jgi:hypothetical protein
MALTTKFKLTADEFLGGQRVFNRYFAPPIARFNYRYAIPVGILLLIEGALGLFLKWNIGISLFLLGFSAYLITFRTIFGPIIVRKEFAQYLDLVNDKTMEFGEEKIFVQTSHGKGESLWTRYSRFVETHDLIVLFAPPRLIHTIPKRAVSSEELTDLRKLLQRKLPGN